MNSGKSFLIYAAVYIEFLINCDMGEHTTIHIFFFNSEIKKNQIKNECMQSKRHFSMNKIKSIKSEVYYYQI